MLGVGKRWLLLLQFTSQNSRSQLSVSSRLLKGQNFFDNIIQKLSKKLTCRAVSRIAIFTSIAISGAFVVLQISYIKKNCKIVTNVFDVERHSPSYIYIQPSPDDKSKTSEAKISVEQVIKDFLKDRRVVWFPWIQTKSGDPWILLKLCKSDDRQIRTLGVHALSQQHDWEDFQYRNIAQACDARTLVGLGRSTDADGRFFRTPPKLPPQTHCVEDEFRILLTSLPKSGVNKCLQHFTSKALHEGNIAEERGGLWCFGGTGLEFAKSVSPVPEEKVEVFCLEALVNHSTVPSHCVEILRLGAMPLLHRVYMKNKRSVVIRRHVARIIGNLAVHKDLHSDIINAGWVSVLAQWMNCSDLSLSLHSARALANLDTDIGTRIFDDGIYLMHPIHRHRGVSADIVFLHGLLGGPFKTWRQQDRRPVQKPQDLGASKYTFSWPKDWLAKDCPNIRILTLEYDTNLSDWSAKCPFENEKRTLHMRATALLEKLSRAEVGSRPIIWVGHSMGGLLIKQILSLAQADGKYRSLVNNTIGVVFYGVPHRGSSLAAISNQASFILNPSIEVQELSKDSSKLRTLHTNFQQYVIENNIPCLSFGEMEKTQLGSVKLKLFIVPPESSDPGVGEFHTMCTNHLNICKPSDRDSDLYKLTLKFVKKCLRQSAMESLLKVGFARE